MGGWWWGREKVGETGKRGEKEGVEEEEKAQPGIGSFREEQTGGWQWRWNRRAIVVAGLGPASVKACQEQPRRWQVRWVGARAGSTADVMCGEPDTRLSDVRPVSRRYIPAASHTSHIQETHDDEMMAENSHNYLAFQFIFFFSALGGDFLK